MPAQRPIRILIVLSRMDIVTATVRGLQFKSLFDEDANFSAEYCVWLPPWLFRLSQLWPQRRFLAWPMRCLQATVLRWREANIASKAKQYDLVYLITVYSDPLYRRLFRQGSRVITELIDGLWLPWFRQFGWHQLEDILEQSAAVFCENRYTAAYASRFNERVFIVTDSPQVEVFDRWRARVERSQSETILGWIGGKDAADALYVVYEALERLFARHDSLHLRILGVPPERLPRFENVRYSLVERYDQETMVQEALQMHIGLFPQFDVEESVCRGTLKAKIYMAGEAAAVCQDHGENRDLIEDGVNGMLAAGTEQWFEKLAWLIEHPEQRNRIAAAGLATIRSRCTAGHCFEQLRSALEQCAPADR